MELVSKSSAILHLPPEFLLLQTKLCPSLILDTFLVFYQVLLLVITKHILTC